MRGSPRIGCLGEVMLELIPGAGETARLGVAGDTYNTAVYLARAMPDAQVDFITVLGRDGLSARIRSHMTRYNVGASRVADHPTLLPGLYAIETDETGERSFTYWRSNSAARCLGGEGMPPLGEMLAGLTHLYFSGISLAILPQANRDRLMAEVALFRRSGGAVAFDSNYRPHLWEDIDTARRETARAWRLTDIALPSLDDEQALFGEMSEADVLTRLNGYGCKQGALKRGANGPVALDGTAPDITDTQVQVIDTTAAGDSFNAGFLTATLEGHTRDAAMRAGHTLACQVVGAPGAIIF